MGDIELVVNKIVCFRLDMNKNCVNIKEELNVYFNLKVWIEWWYVKKFIKIVNENMNVYRLYSII